MAPFVVTITRQFGSLGRPIAKRMAELLEIQYYDRDIVETTSQKLGLPVSTISEEEEAAKSHFFNMRFPLGMGTNEIQDAIFKEQSRIIKELAEKESCIIVGRLSDYILSNHKNCMNIFIYAGYEARLRNCTDILLMEGDTAKRMIRQVDKARDSYHLNYAKFLPGDYNHKDILIDSSLLGVDGTARQLAECVKARFIQERDVRY